ncbi:hypothetical protein AVEN_68732-1 [Araneus ventricosus]|uniref:Uncharacterized protein n=1 Tax=Araneus ventricosus TaxID=182803 RepID=A0A4Y2WEN5_ARAVE|nr:hypothetical protein AVEN_68732-1 [Araneus ventricosus]
MVITPPEGVATMIITPPGSRPWLSHLQKGRDHGFITPQGVATMIIPTSRECDHDYHTSRGSRPLLSPQRSRDHCYHTSEVATMDITPPGSRPIVITPQRGRDHCYHTSRKGRDHDYHTTPGVAL